MLFVMAVVYGLLAGSTSLFDRDEPRNARAAMEMLSSGDYLVPTFNGELRSQKPPLTYWVMNVPLRVASWIGDAPSSLAARTPSIFGMLVAVWGTYMIGRRMFNHRVGLWAMIMLATSPLAAFMGTFATTDGLLLGCIVISVLGYVWILTDRWRWSYALLMLVALALGQLTKGPIALLPLAGIVLGMRIMLGDRLRLGDAFWWSFVIAIHGSFLAFAAWFVPVTMRTQGAMFQEMAMGQFVERLFVAQEGHGAGGSGLVFVLKYIVLLPMYLVIILGTFFPWTIHLPSGISALIRGHLAHRRERAFLWSWLLPTLVVFSLVVTKLPHYVLPIYPALALLGAALIDARARGHLSEKDRDWLRGGIYFFAPAALVFAVAIVAGPMWLVGVDGVMFMPAMGIVVAVGVYGVKLQLQEQVFRVSRLLAVAVVMFVVVAAPALAWIVEPVLKTSPPIAAAIRERLAEHPDASVSWHAYHEPTLVYYINLPASRSIENMSLNQTSLDAWAGEDKPGALITYADKLDDLTLPKHVRIIHETRTLNYAKQGQRKRIVVLWRQP